MCKGTKICTVITLLICLMILSNCGSVFYCNVSGYGTTPISKSYYVVPSDSTLIGDFAFEEYANQLKIRLNESGYQETSPECATLCIVLGYFIGKEKYCGSTTTSTSYSSTTPSYVVNIGNFSSTTNTKTTTRNSTLSESAVYQTSVGVDILAKDNHSGKNLWKIEIRDNINSQSPTTFRALMPWLIACAQPYFGQCYEGQPQITKFDGEKMGLKWPY